MARRIMVLSRWALVVAAFFMVGSKKAPVEPELIQKLFGNADKVTLYSIKPRRLPKSKSKKLKGWPILGQNLVSGDRLSRLKDAISDSLADPPEDYAMCFNPRHGVQVKKKNGDTVTALICFECNRIEFYPVKKEMETFQISKEGHKQLDGLLVSYKLPLAKD